MRGGGCTADGERKREGQKETERGYESERTCGFISVARLEKEKRIITNCYARSTSTLAREYELERERERALIVFLN